MQKFTNGSKEIKVGKNSIKIYTEDGIVDVKIRTKRTTDKVSVFAKFSSKFAADWEILLFVVNHVEGKGWEIAEA